MLAEELHISCQAVSKWENFAAFPDISLLPRIADYFGITLDELFDHKLNAYTYKERFIQLMLHSGVLTFTDNHAYQINTENFTTNAQIAKIGECFADLIRENNLDFDGIMGHSYHGNAFSAATAFSLYQKYGITTFYCFDRKTPDNRGRKICGYTPCRGDKIIVIDDLIGSGNAINPCLETLTNEYDVEISAVICIIDTHMQNPETQSGTEQIKAKYHTDVFTMITDKDIRMAQAKKII